MNILHLIESSEAGGAETVVLSLAKALRENGNNCVIGLLEAGWLNDQLKEAGLKTIVLEQNKSYDLTCLWRLVTLIRNSKIDLIHAHEFMMNVYGTLAGLLTGVPIITTVHGKNYFWLKKRRRVAYRLVSRFAKMVAVSEDLRRFLADQIGISKSKVITLYNGIDCKQYAAGISLEAIASIKEDLAIAPESKVIGTVGMLVPVKDHKTLLKAAKHLVSRRADVIFLIIGDGELLASLKNEARELGITPKVRFSGFRKDIPDLLRLIDIYVCPSISEGLSLSILEAMAAGKPVVATNVGGNPEIVVDGHTGFLVPPEDPEALASKISILLNDRYRAHQFGLNGQRRVYENFSLDRMISSYQQLYKRALHQY